MKAKALKTKVGSSPNKIRRGILSESAHIFRSNLNNNFKLTPFNTKFNDNGHVRYLPPVSKEWKNTIYAYYKQNMQNLPIDSKNANKVLESYFNLHFANNRFIGSKFISPKTRSLLLHKIYVSKMETKHTNSKTIITLYTINTEKNNVYNNYLGYNKFWENQILKSFKKGLKQKIKEGFITYPVLNPITPYPPAGDQGFESNGTGGFAILRNEKKLLVSKYKYLTESLPCFNIYLRLYLSRHFKNSYLDKLDLLRKYQLNYYLNKFKFEKNTYLHKLSNMLSRVFNNNIEFNIVNLKSVAFSPDIFTDILSLKIRKPNVSNFVGVMNSLLKVSKLPEVNRIQEKASFFKSKDYALLENIYPNLNIISCLQVLNNYGLLSDSLVREDSGCYLNFLLAKKSLIDEDSILGINPEFSLPEGYEYFSDLYEREKEEYIRSNISNKIFNSIKYKNLGGIRLELKGRLTKRNRADRSQFKFKWKGGLKNIDSSYKKLPTVTYRGYYKPSVISALSQSKRAVGSFAVKGWISGK